ncbi:hypothetical protein [Nonomuraea basaltis]|uniref:hypothetical protein n=1 Tax=Nonomuraea basaltis TaxID=2495887 RepID=UPI00110C6367|nr:hypothetical protein [Nonomuraea basaltis]TMS00186.1 hypothetical protein EJK15_03685 [Nonomuraea basaltis]
MATLASKCALETRLGRVLSAEEGARADALLEDASALVRSYTRQDFAPPASETVVLRASSGVVRLPKTPVTAVTAVVAVGVGGGPDLALAGWVFDGIDVIDVAGWDSLIINLPETLHDTCLPPTYRVTYAPGYAAVPADVVAVVCAMAMRTLTAPTMAAGVTSETIGSYSYRLDSGGIGTSVQMGASEKMVLDRYRRKADTITVRMR